jgi:N-acetylmuramoyl-L-alanine amidase
MRSRLCLALALGTAVSGIVVFAAVLTAQQPDQSIDAAAVRRAIEDSLAAAPRRFERLQPPLQTGVRVLDVASDPLGPRQQRITINVSQKVITYDPSGDVEAILDHILRSTASLLSGGDRTDYRFLVDGIPLDQFVTRAGARSTVRRSLANGGSVVVSPGHGWYWDEAAARWRLQRDFFWGIVEDFVNWDIASYVREELAATRIRDQPARQPDRGAAAGVAGQPAWQDAAVYFIRGLGVPSAVWDIGVNDYARDINSRPLFANWIDAAAVVSIHNNGGGGTGTETWYDTSNGYEADSARLAALVNTHVVNAIRASYNAAWPDRGLRSCNGCKGENRLAARPAVILEVAFMDTKSPDNDALHDERFKQIVGRAIRDALMEFH